MDLSRQEYPAMLASLEPSQAIYLLNSRLEHVSKTNQDIANWLEERRRIEEAYVNGLRKLARRQPPNVDSELGIFTSPWQRILEAARELADSHSEFASRIEHDIILSLRQFDSSNREMQQMSTIQGNLASLARDYDQAQKKAAKVKSQGGKASAEKAAGASDQIESAAQQWESQAPYVFEQLQAVDETRLNHLRDVLTQLETHEVDHVEKTKLQAESCLNSLLNVNIADEIKQWSTKSQDGVTRLTSRTDRARTPSRDERPQAPPPTSRMERRMSRNVSGNNTLAPPPLPTSNGDDRTSQREPSFNDEKKQRPRGLKRLGTVFSKRRQSMMPSLGRSAPGRHKARLGSSTNLPGEDVPELPTPQPLAKDRDEPISPIPPSAITEPGSSAENRPRPEIDETDKTASHGGITNGVSRLQEPLVPSSTGGATPRATQQPSQVQARTETTPSTTTNERFTTPPQSIDNDPISAAQREAAAALGAPDDYSEFPDQSQQQQAFNLSIRNAPIAEENSAANTAAMTDVANTLRAQAPKRMGTLRGRRDVRNTVFIPSDQLPAFDSGAPPAPGTMLSTTAPSQITASPISTPSAYIPSSLNSTPQPPQRPFAADDRASSDTQSIRSGHSLASTTNVSNALIRHPDIHAPGLNSSIIESVSATFEAGKLTRGTVTGELALAYTPTTINSQPKDTIRLDNFPILEKVAPNPAFIHDIGQSTSADRKGEYTVDLSALSSHPFVAFKYQLHIPAMEPASVLGRHTPLVVTPSWKCEEKQTSVIVSYGLHPAFAAAATEEVTLTNVVLLLFLEGTRTTTCQSRPAGTFAREKSMIYWRFDELRLGRAHGVQKALARFATEGMGRPGRVEVRFEMPAVASGTDLGVSRLEGGAGDPFADEAGWRPLQGVRRVVAAGYVGV